jgi:hypothetical protein
VIASPHQFTGFHLYCAVHETACVSPLRKRVLLSDTSFPTLGSVIQVNAEKSNGLNSVSTAAGTPLLTPVQLGALSLPNRSVMSPITRARSRDGIPIAIEAHAFGSML